MYFAEPFFSDLQVNASTFIISLEDESQILKDLADEMKLMTGDLKIEINEVGTKQDVLEQQSRHDFEKLSNDFHLQLKNQEEELNKVIILAESDSTCTDIEIRQRATCIKKTQILLKNQNVATA